MQVIIANYHCKFMFDLLPNQDVKSTFVEKTRSQNQDALMPLAGSSFANVKCSPSRAKTRSGKTRPGRCRLNCLQYFRFSRNRFGPGDVSRWPGPG